MVLARCRFPPYSVSDPVPGPQAIPLPPGRFHPAEVRRVSAAVGEDSDAQHERRGQQLAEGGLGPLSQPGTHFLPTRSGRPEVSIDVCRCGRHTLTAPPSFTCSGSA